MSKSSLNPDLYLYPSRFWSRAGSKNLFGADASMKKKKIKQIFLPPLRALLFWVGKFAHALEG